MALCPTSTAEVAAIVADAAAAGTTLEVVGTAMRRGIGRPVAADAVLSLAGLAGVIDYDPAELVLTARAGTPLAEIGALVATAGQHLAFEPPDLAPLWGGPAGAGTLGGMLAIGFGGPRRPAAGAPRDHFLGCTAVNGRGETFAAGGRVIKNVTGYDLPKLLAGSFGTLAVLTEVTLKVLPAPRAATTVTLSGLADAAAIAAMTRALNSPACVTGAAHDPRATRLGGGPVRGLTRLRIEGGAGPLAVRSAYLVDLLADFGRAEIADEPGAWHAIGAVAALLPADHAVWRISVPPSAAVAVVVALGPRPHYYYDWGGGLIWLGVPDVGDAGAAAIRGALAGSDGHATLVRASVATRAAVEPFHPLAPGLAALDERVRQRFDPNDVLNPGRRRARS